MNIGNKFHRTIIVLLLGALALNYQYLIWEKEFGHFGNLIINTGVIIFLILVAVDFSKFKENKSISNFLPTIIAVSLIIIGYGLDFYYKQQENVPILIQGYKKVGSDGKAYFDFNEDGSFWFIDMYSFDYDGGINIFRGTYQIRDSIITLKCSEAEKSLGCNQLVIRKNENKIYRIGTSLRNVGFKRDKSELRIIADNRKN